MAKRAQFCVMLNVPLAIPITFYIVLLMISLSNQQSSHPKILLIKIKKLSTIIYKGIFINFNI